ncbi:hypothetical protein Sjap_003989 [Stephania japonica]|uniref:Uncharacterized protein n=1 Tax=Stephania japonica TaxID=461633 RepID=A0AAP0PKG6_9MAGN
MIYINFITLRAQNHLFALLLFVLSFFRKPHLREGDMFLTLHKIIYLHFYLFFHFLESPIFEKERCFSFFCYLQELDLIRVFRFLSKLLIR